MFLIHDHQAKRLHRCEHRRASTDHDARPALPNLVPFVVPLPGGEVAVQHGDQCLLRPVAEPRLEPLNRLWRQRNFRHEHDGSLPLVKCMRDRLQVHLRLAAAGHAVQQKQAVGLRFGFAFGRLGQALHRADDLLQRGRLFGVQLEWL